LSPDDAVKVQTMNPAENPKAEAAVLLRARNQTILVYILLLLHPLFGITALIGAIVCHMKPEVTAGSVFASHRTWQLWTFWGGVIGYVSGVYYIIRFGSWLILGVSAAWMLYRVLFGWWKALRNQPVGLRPLPGNETTP